MTKLKSSKVHMALTILWLVLAIPTILVWRESILWVALISVYANVVGHWSSWEAAKAKEAANEAIKQHKNSSAPMA